MSGLSDRTAILAAIGTLLAVTAVVVALDTLAELPESSPTLTIVLVVLPLT